MEKGTGQEAQNRTWDRSGRQKRTEKGRKGQKRAAQSSPPMTISDCTAGVHVSMGAWNGWMCLVRHLSRHTPKPKSSITPVILVLVLVLVLIIIIATSTEDARSTHLALEERVLVLGPAELLTLHLAQHLQVRHLLVLSCSLRRGCEHQLVMGAAVACRRL
eukprot:3632059-Rhodomonas_salina.2